MLALPKINMVILFGTKERQKTIWRTNTHKRQSKSLINSNKNCRCLCLHKRQTGKKLATSVDYQKNKKTFIYKLGSVFAVFCNFLHQPQTPIIYLGLRSRTSSINLPASSDEQPFTLFTKRSHAL